MALKTYSPSGHQEGALTGIVYDDVANAVLYIGILKPDASTPVSFTVIRQSDGTEWTAPDAGGNDLVDVSTQGLTFDDATGATNWGFRSSQPPE